MVLTQKIPPSEIGFDFDGVIADTTETFIRLACEQHDYCSFTLEDITDFQVEECIPIPAELVDRIFLDILQDSIGVGLQPMPDAVKVLGELAAHAPITIITARHLEQPVIDWLDAFLPQSTRKAMRLHAMGDHDDKLRYIKEHQLKYFVDDRAETCNRLAAADITPLVFSSPWNRDRHKLPIVENWQDIRGLLALG